MTQEERTELQKEIERARKEYAKEIKKNGMTKRAMFFKSMANRYEQKLEGWD